VVTSLKALTRSESYSCAGADENNPVSPLATSASRLPLGQAFNNLRSLAIPLQSQPWIAIRLFITRCQLDAIADSSMCRVYRCPLRVISGRDVMSVSKAFELTSS
jgi:hypothetical protein